MCVCARACVCVYVCVRTSAHAGAHACVLVYAHMRECVCMCTCECAFVGMLMLTRCYGFGPLTALCTNENLNDALSMMPNYSMVLCSVIPAFVSCFIKPSTLTGPPVFLSW